MSVKNDQTEFYDWDRLDTLKFVDEEAFVETLLEAPALDVSARQRSVQQGQELVRIARSKTRRKGVMESFLEEFGLSNSEGLALMCLAEALLRVPDAETRDELIAEKIRSGDWASHQGQSDSWLVNASTWGLMLTGRVIGLRGADTKDEGTAVQSLIRSSGEPVIRAAMMQAMRIMGEQFVLGRDVKAALKRGRKMVRAEEAAHFSFDMLGEGARTHDDALRYLAAYQSAIEAIGEDRPADLPPEDVSGVSVKLSALHPRYEAGNSARVLDELYPRLLSLCEAAAKADINLCLDAEEADRLVISLKLFAKLANEPSLHEWTGLGLAVQAYQKRAGEVIAQLIDLANATGRRFMVRLVKGAYWDSEIKHAHEEGHPNFPVFTTKQATDVNYLACAKAMLEAGPALYPQFATHNAHSLAAIMQMAEELGVTAFEYQRLHGMGDALYDAAGAGRRVRVYAPVGAHEDLLPYLVRRLLENGANTSFVHSFLDADVPVEHVVEDPFAKIEAGPRRHPRIPTPPRLYGPDRPNSKGLDVSQISVRNAFEAICKTTETKPRQPDASESDIDAAISSAEVAQKGWDAIGGNARAIILRQMGDALEDNTMELIALMAREAGKTLADGISEVREAVDFCRYYASEAERKFGAPERLPGPAGETNHISLHGRGVFACISPWNFPLAIFTGQLAAALAAGNGVVAKPAEQTPLIAAEAVRLFREAGLPEDILHLVTGAGDVGATLTRHAGISGVCFTGGTRTARSINQALAQREGAIIPLIAETGGMNAMFVDTTALREQVIDDMIASAFGSAGQRCSALRLAVLPYQTADMLIEGLKGAMDELAVGDPSLSTTDIGPVIDAEAHAALETHLARMASEARLIKQLPVKDQTIGSSVYFGPALVELSSLDQLKEESFGPILHILRYDPDDITELGAALAVKGYGLTLGVHSRLERFAEAVREAVPAGNTYVNRTMIGAVVGVQPFGGEGLSGTGPKAGGPHYLVRFAAERVVTVNITAQGGDPELLSL